jgi:membrane-associated phospholipid phosphatase
VARPTLPHQPIPDASAIAWRWQRFRPIEYPLTFGALAGAMVARFVAKPPSANWRGGILFDEALQRRFAINELPRRSTVVGLTDVGFYGAMAYRLIDSAYVPAVVYGRPEVALQLSMIDLESFSFVAAVLWLPHLAFGRERPLATHCRKDAEFRAGEPVCADDHTERNRSFFGGHPAVALTAAGLTCTHHRHLPLYGGGAADKLACALTLASAAATGVGRMVTENHYATDVLWGWGVGAFAGFVMPEVLHYRRELPTAKPVAAKQSYAAAAPVRVSLQPSFSSSELALRLAGTF